MYSSASHTRILIALTAGAAIVLVAWFFSDHNRSDVEKVSANIPVAVAPEREAIPVIDSNSDGVPDWQEAFSQTGPLALNAASSTYEAPDTLTEQFSIDFFEQMVRNETYGDFGASTDEFIGRSSDYLAAQASDELITKDQVTISQNNTPTALANYGEAVARIIVTNSEDEAENEAVLLDRILDEGREEDIAALNKKIDIYNTYLTATNQLPVPSIAVNEHLALVNSYQAIRNDIAAMSSAQNDPMLALLRLKRYQDDADGLYFSIVNLYTKLINQGATWPASSVVYQLIALEDN